MNADPPPANIDAEKAILGAILLDNNAFAEVAEKLTLEDFFLDSHRRIWRRVAGLIKKQRAVDIVTLANELTQLAEMSDRVEVVTRYELAKAEAMRQVAERLSITEDPAPTVRPDGVLFFRGIAFGLLFTAGVVAVVLLSVYHQQILAWVREAAR